MTETVAKVGEVVMPIGHRFGKLLVGAIAAFAAKETADKLYDKAYTAFQNRSAAS